MAKSKSNRMRKKNEREPLRGCIPIGKERRNSEGKIICRYPECNNIVPKGRRTFCSAACVHEHKLRSNNDYMRAAVFARDKGICAICKIDCREILEKIRSQEYSEETTIALFNAGFPHWRLNKASKKGIVLWDADHIIPIDQGGGGCGVQGMRTLCAACHWRVTRTQSILKNIPDPTKQITLWGSQLASEF